MSQPLPADSTTLRAALWMMGSVVSFCAMAISARELLTSMSSYQILLLRSLFGALFVGLVVVRADPSLLRSRQPGLQVVRHALHFVGQVLWIMALGWLPLALVFAVEFTSPVWGALTAVLLLGERLTRNRVLAMAAGLFGVLVIVRPGVAAFDPAILAIVLAAVVFGVINAMTKKLLSTDRPWGVLFWMCVSQTLLCLPFALPGFVMPGVAELPWVAGVAITGVSAHYCLNRSLGMADASVVLPMDFIRLPLVAGLALVLYGEPFDPWIFLGAFIICLGIWQNLRAEARL